YNEADTLPLLQPRILAALDQAQARFGLDGRVLYVDDGSRDATWQVMCELAAADPRIGLLRLSRNFGKEIALTAGLDTVERGGALILDADGQDPPELMPQFIEHWRQGYDDVHGTRVVREGEDWIKRGTAHLFYRRSEERRVGKECRARWAPYHEQKEREREYGRRGGGRSV